MSCSGEVAAWYTLAAMGLYSLAPGTPDYVLGAPLFGHVQLTVEGSNVTINVVGLNAGPDNIYVEVCEQIHGLPSKCCEVGPHQLLQ